MNSVVDELERQVRSLPREGQLWLVERVVHNLRAADERLTGDLAAMAAEPDIQREIRAIEAEFTMADSDGLEL